MGKDDEKPHRSLEHLVELDADVPVSEDLIRTAIKTLGPLGQLLEKTAAHLSNDVAVRAEASNQNHSTLMQKAVENAIEPLKNDFLKAIGNYVEQRAAELERQKQESARRNVTCVILCGGAGRRLWPVTNTKPKVLLPLGGQSVLERLLTQLRSSVRVREIILATDPATDPRSEELYKLIDRGATGCATPIKAQADREGCRGPLAALENIVREGNSEILLVGGDNIFDAAFDFDSFIAAARTDTTKGYDQAGGLAVASIDTHKHQISELGQVNVDEHHHVTDLLEKEQSLQYNYVSSACYYLRKRHTDLLGNFLQSRAKPALGQYINWLCKHSDAPPIVAYPMDNPWFDMGDVEQYLEAYKYYLNHQLNNTAEHETPARDQRTQIRHPSWVLTDVTSMVLDSEIGPYAHIGPNVKIERSRIVNSVILEGAKVIDAEVRNSLVGPSATVQGECIGRVCGAYSTSVGPERATVHPPHFECKKS